MSGIVSKLAKNLLNTRKPLTDATIRTFRTSESFFDIHGTDIIVGSSAIGAVIGGTIGYNSVDTKEGAAFSTPIGILVGGGVGMGFAALGNIHPLVPFLCLSSMVVPYCLKEDPKKDSGIQQKLTGVTVEQVFEPNKSPEMGK